ncbi:MAG: hypothetical protein ACFCBW_10020 [Candidatus Competibacterales bacterium]
MLNQVRYPAVAFIITLTLYLTVGIAKAVPIAIAGVDFEGGTSSVFDRNPDDLDPNDGISVSSGDNGVDVFSGWNLLQFAQNGNPPRSFSGLLRNDIGANDAGSTSPDFPARLEDNTRGSWSINIPNNVLLDLDRVEFDVRGATSASGRGAQFNTSLDGDNILWEDLNLPGRTSGFIRIVVDLSDMLYQDLTDQSVAFNWISTTAGAIDLDTIEVYGTAEVVVAAPIPISFFAWFGLIGFFKWRCRTSKI